MASRCLVCVLVGLCACGMPQEPETPEDPEQRAIERVLAEPDPGPAAHADAHESADERAPEQPATAKRDTFPWLHDLVMGPDDADLEAAFRRREAEKRTADERLFDRFAQQLVGGDVAAWRDAALVLLRDEPTSPFVPYVYLALAEHSLDTGKPDHVVAFLKKVLTFPDAHVRAFAWHDLAWAHMQSRPPDHVEALHSFMNCIRETERPEYGFPSSARALRTRARHDLVIPYAAVGDPTKARNFFERVGRGPGDEDLVEEMLTRLASQK